MPPISSRTSYFKIRSNLNKMIRRIYYLRNRVDQLEKELKEVTAAKENLANQVSRFKLDIQDKNTAISRIQESLNDHDYAISNREWAESSWNVEDQISID